MKNMQFFFLNTRNFDFPLYTIYYYIFSFVLYIIQGVNKVPGQLNISSDKIFLKKVKVISKITCNEEFNGDL